MLTNSRNTVRKLHPQQQQKETCDIEMETLTWRKVHWNIPNLQLYLSV